MMIFLAAAAVMAFLGGDLCSAATTGIDGSAKGSTFVVPLTREKKPGFYGNGHKERVHWNNEAYLGYISVGNPPQSIYVDFDTGSDQLWVLGDNPIVNCKWKDGSDRCYHYKNSKTHGPVNKSDTFEVSYGTGSAAGFYIEDHVDVAGVKVIQEMGNIDIVDRFFESQMTYSKMSGIIGLSLYNERASFIQKLLNTKLLEKNLFSIKLTTKADANSITFGSWDKKIVSENDIHWIPIVSTSLGFWAFNSESISVAGSQVIGQTTIIADTGCTYSILGPQAFDAIAKPMGAYMHDEETMRIKAKDEANLKDITFTINGRAYTLAPSDYIARKVGDELELGFCVWNDDSTLILGDPFLRKFYSIFDFEHQQIAFAPHGGKY